MKHLIKTSVLLLALCMPMAAMAYEFIVDGIYYSTDLWGDYVMVCDQGEDGGHYSGNVSIPTSITHDDTTYPVARINAYAFSKCGELTGVSIPETITEIGDHSFEECTSLTEVKIPGAVTYIGSCAFENCSSLTSVNIPATVTEIKIWSFQGCTSLTDVYCDIADPSQVELGMSAFKLEDENYSARTLHVPAGSVAAYKNSEWNDFFGNIVEK